MVLAVFSLVPAIVLAQETFTHSESGLKFTLPAGWTYNHEGDFFEANAPDDSLFLLFFVGKGAEVEAVINGAVDEMSAIIKDPKITTDYTQEEVNGLLQVYVEGDGLLEGEPVDWDLTCVKGRNKSLVVIAIGDIEGQQRVIGNIYRSIHQ